MIIKRNTNIGVILNIYLQVQICKIISESGSSVWQRIGSVKSREKSQKLSTQFQTFACGGNNMTFEAGLNGWMDEQMAISGLVSLPSCLSNWNYKIRFRRILECEGEDGTRGLRGREIVASRYQIFYCIHLSRVATYIKRLLSVLSPDGVNPSYIPYTHLVLNS